MCVCKYLYKLSVANRVIHGNDIFTFHDPDLLYIIAPIAIILRLILIKVFDNSGAVPTQQLKAGVLNSTTNATPIQLQRLHCQSWMVLAPQGFTMFYTSWNTSTIV